ncbi:calponin-homology (CH) domain-containing protein, partial [Haematococcus lacustris]
MYTCKDFGKVLKGRLLVATNDSQYSFELVGRMPSYVPPKTQDFKASIDNKLSAQLAAQLALASSTSRESGRPNFVAANVKRTRGR